MAFTTWGPVRGCCGHEHDTMDEAEACRVADARGCRSQGEVQEWRSENPGCAGNWS